MIKIVVKKDSKKNLTSGKKRIKLMLCNFGYNDETTYQMFQMSHENLQTNIIGENSSRCRSVHSSRHSAVEGFNLDNEKQELNLTFALVANNVSWYRESVHKKILSIGNGDFK